MIGAGNLAPWLPFSWLSVAIFAGSMLGAWWAGRAMPRFGLGSHYAWSLYPVAMVTGVAGAKLWSAGETWLEPGVGTFTGVLLAREGVTFYGGLILGAAGVVGKVLCDRKSLWAVSTVLAPTLALSQAIGRIGCFLVGCDSGVATSLPWGMSFPNADPPVNELVHPAQLYEAAWLLASAWWLRSRLGRSRVLIGEYLLLQGVGRFAIEAIRTNPPVLGPFTLSQGVAAICVFASMLLLSMVRRVEFHVEGR